MVLPCHLAYTCIYNLACLIIPATSIRRVCPVQNHDDEDWDQVWVGAHLATMTQGPAPYGGIADAALTVRGERIAWIGPAGETPPLAPARGARVHDVAGLWMTPGLIDCHTHLVYGDNRVADYEKRLGGASYEQIARAGGGIQSTVRATRAATPAALQASAEVRARRLMAEG